MPSRASLAMALLAGLVPPVPSEPAPPRPRVSLTDGLWADRSVREVDSGADHRVFEVPVANGTRSHRVVVFHVEDQTHDEARAKLTRGCEHWWPIKAIPEMDIDEANAFSCPFSMEGADALLERFVARHGALLQRTLNISDCRNREDMDEGQPPRVFVTALSSSMPADTWHSDGCRGMERPTFHEFFTVLLYPEKQWDKAWGGHVEFAGEECGERSDGDRDAQAPALLRISPRPDRAVIFSGPLVHRATRPIGTYGPPIDAPPPTLWDQNILLGMHVQYDGVRGPLTSGVTPDWQANAAARSSWRTSLVMQVVCQTRPYTPVLEFLRRAVVRLVSPYLFPQAAGHSEELEL